MLLSQLGPKPTRPKPSRPKTNSAQNQVGPKPPRPNTHSALDYEILLLSSSLSPFLFLLLPSFVLCTGNLFQLKECQFKKIGNLECCKGCNFQTVTVMWSVLFGMGMSLRIHFWYQVLLKMLIFFFQKMKKKKTKNKKRKQKTLFWFKRFLERQKLKVWVKKYINGLKITLRRIFFFFKSFFFFFQIFN